MKVQQQKYGFSRTVDLPFDKALEVTRQSLQREEFGILSEIRLDTKLKEKLGVDFRQYVILGACMPPLAYKGLQREINMGLLLPCNVVVYEADDKEKSVVAAVDAEAMLSVVGDDPVLKDVAREVNERLAKVVEQI
jgi:uncharacterized protein (DUF302 family)